MTTCSAGGGLRDAVEAARGAAWRTAAQLPRRYQSRRRDVLDGHDDGGRTTRSAAARVAGSALRCTLRAPTRFRGAGPITLLRADNSTGYRHVTFSYDPSEAARSKIPYNRRTVAGTAATGSTTSSAPSSQTAAAGSPSLASTRRPPTSRCSRSTRRTHGGGGGGRQDVPVGMKAPFSPPPRPPMARPQRVALRGADVRCRWRRGPECRRCRSVIAAAISPAGRVPASDRRDGVQAPRADLVTRAACVSARRRGPGPSAR